MLRSLGGGSVCFYKLDRPLSHLSRVSLTTPTLYLRVYFLEQFLMKLLRQVPAENEQQSHGLIEENLISGLILEVWPELKE